MMPSPGSLLPANRSQVAAGSMLVVLNKVDLLPEAERAKAVRRAAKRLAQTLAMTRFAAAPMVPVAAKVAAAVTASEPGGGLKSVSIGMEDFKAQLVAMVPDNPRVAQVLMLLLHRQLCEKVLLTVQGLQ